MSEPILSLRGLNTHIAQYHILHGVEFDVPRGQLTMLLGRNGAGKTTLLKMVASALEPDQGSVRLGANVKLGYFAQQSLDLLDPARTVFEQMQHDFPMAGQGVLRTLLGAFQFSGPDIDKPIRILSGGEKSRLVMARMLFDPPNFLVLDEPTNHLDLETKEMLVGALRDFEGTMLFVSHDRTFLRGLSNRVLELRPGDGKDVPAEPPLLYPGTYVEYVARTGSEAAGVHR
jgi:ATPase subunit of ABC transporter with duplicated ATPase domains